MLVTLSDNSISKGRASSSHGAGCSGVGVLACDLGSLPAGASATMRIPVAAASGRKIFVGANAVAEQNDAAPADNSGSLQLKMLPGKLKRFTFGVVPGRTSAGVLVVYVKLSAAARVTAQFYVQGAPQPIAWRRSLPAGTTAHGLRCCLSSRRERITRLSCAPSAESTRRLRRSSSSPDRPALARHRSNPPDRRVSSFRSRYVDPGGIPRLGDARNHVSTKIR